MNNKLHGLSWNWFVLIGLLYTTTRVYIWIAKPIDFSQITDVYMPYAHLWATGTMPYLQQWYEYPPATIPLFYLPHMIDMATRYFPWHINYGIAYRSLLMLADIGLFSLIIVCLRKFKVSPQVFVGALFYYCLATAKAHDFIYDSMDLIFIGVMVLGIMVPLLLNGIRGQLVEWFAYFLAVALKIINAPLGLVYAVFERHSLKRLLATVVVAGMVVWSVPLAVFRSSLSVVLVYHSARGLQVESVPAQIAAVINRFTKTEVYDNQYRSMNISGPVSQRVKRIDDLLFYPVIILFIIWGIRSAWIAPLNEQTSMKLALTMGYLFCFMLLGKVLSTPYHLWPIPLLAIYPFKSLKQQLTFTVPSLVMIIISMTKIPNLPVGILNVHLLIGIARSLIIAYLFWQTVGLVRTRKVV